MVPPGTTNTSAQGGDFQFRSSSGTLGLMSKVHGVFNNQYLPSTSGRQSRNTAIDYIFGEHLLNSLEQQLGRGFLVVLVFLLVMVLGKKIVSPNRITSFKLCV